MYFTVKILKLGPHIITVIILNMKRFNLQCSKMRSIDADSIANSVDPDSTVPTGADRFGAALFLKSVCANN